MAEAVVTFFLQRLSSFINEEANLLTGVDEEIRLLQNELEWMRLFIKNADAKRRVDSEVKLMVSQIREITFKAEDVIDEFILKVHQRGGRQPIDFHWFTRSIKNCISCTHQLSLLHELANKIKEINTTSEKISANKSKYCIEAGEASYSLNDVSSLQRVIKVKRAPITEDVVGIEDSMKQVLSLVIGGGDDNRRRNIVSIAGMGGLGKTTLAKKVYNSTDVKRHFDCFAWVSVSQEYRLTELLQGIIKCFRMYIREELEELKKLDAEELRQKLHDYLRGDKKYLIVLDDIWDVEAWDGLNSAFPDEMNGSRVLLTTRNKHVALYADPSPNNIHGLRFLNEMESWELFLKKIFPLGGGESNSTHESRCPPELEDLGKEMVEKCRGLPLAILVLGGLLSIKDKIQIIWAKVNANVSWQLTQGAGSHSCSEILALSYYDLPYYLKPCFMYMGLFPEDHEISASKLFQCWIAEGFVQSRGRETMEDIAEDYLEELICRSMIQVGRWSYDGRVRTCRIHDLLRDLAIAESKEDQFSQIYGSINDFSKSNNVRRLIIIYGGHDGDQDGFKGKVQNFTRFHYTRYIRSLMCFGINHGDHRMGISILGCLKLLKVLELDNCETPFSIPQELGELIHLKYLGIGVAGQNPYPKVYFPNSVSKLVNLQTLNLKLCLLQCLPSQISSLCQLRYLNVESVFVTNQSDRSLVGRSTNFHLEIGNLTNLQSLCLGSSVGMNCDNLGRLRMLKKLVIKMRPGEKNEVFYSIAKLTGLRSLKLQSIAEEIPAIQFSCHNYLTKLRLDGRLVSEFLFPPNLIKLSLSESKIETELMFQVLAKLKNMKFLALSDDAYIGKKMIFPQGGFLRLQFLKLEFLYELEELIVENGALSSLTHLAIERCYEMEMLPEGLREITSLGELKVSRMPKKFVARLSENEGEDWEKIERIPSVIREHILN